MAAKLARHDATRSNGDFVYLQLATGTANGCGHSHFLSAASLATSCRKYSSNDGVNIEPRLLENYCFYRIRKILILKTFRQIRYNSSFLQQKPKAYFSI